MVRAKQRSGFVVGVEEGEGLGQGWGKGLARARCGGKTTTAHYKWRVHDFILYLIPPAGDLWNSATRIKPCWTSLMFNVLLTTRTFCIVVSGFY